MALQHSDLLFKKLISIKILTKHFIYFNKCAELFHLNAKISEITIEITEII